MPQGADPQADNEDGPTPETWGRDAIVMAALAIWCLALPLAGFCATLTWGFLGVAASALSLGAFFSYFVTERLLVMDDALMTLDDEGFDE